MKKDIVYPGKNTFTGMYCRKVRSVGHAHARGASRGAGVGVRGRTGPGGGASAGGGGPVRATVSRAPHTY